MTKTQIPSREFHQRVAEKTGLKPNTVRVYLADQGFKPDEQDIQNGRVQSYYELDRVGDASRILKNREIQKRGRKPVKKGGDGK